MLGAWFWFAAGANVVIWIGVAALIWLDYKVRP